MPEKVSLFGAWAVYWIRYHLHLPLFRRLPLTQVMAMENPAWYLSRHPENHAKPAQSLS